MASRRQVIQGGTAVGVAAAAGLLSIPAAPAPMRFHTLLYERSAAPAVVFAAEAALRGGSMHSIDGNVTRVWLEQLQPLWRRSPVPIAGLTEFHCLFVLDLMAQAAGLRTVYVAHHLPATTGYAHRLFGPHHIAATTLDGHEELWPRQAAALLMRFPGNVSTARETSNLLDARRYEVRQHTLVSWVIAPVRARPPL